MNAKQIGPLSISRRDFLSSAGIAVATSTVATAVGRNPAGDFLPVMTGVTIAGAEFGTDSPSFSNRQPGILGRDYIYPSEATVSSLVDRGVRLFRIPVRWERLQPDLNGPLLQSELKHLDGLIEIVSKRGGHAIVDLHNYGRCRLQTQSGPKTLRVDEFVNGEIPVKSEQFATFWRELAARYVGHPGIQGYGIMNEPHKMGQSNWKQISQSAVTQIREVDFKSWIFVAGDDWSSAERFDSANGAESWIRDPSFRTAYEAHCYFDRDGSGKYSKSYDQEFRSDPDLLDRPLLRLRNFTRWCERNKVVGFLGEFGVPVADPRWNQLLERFMIELRQRKLSGCIWAAGDWWGNYPLSLQPTGKMSNDSLALKLLRKYC